MENLRNCQIFIDIYIAFLFQVGAFLYMNSFSSLVKRRYSQHLAY